MSRIIFVIFIFVCLVLVGALVVFSLGLLPQSLYSQLYNIESRFSLVPRSSFPYLQKYEGHWSMSLEPSITESDLSPCVVHAGNVSVHDGAVSGVVGALGNALSLRDTSVSQDGTVAGGLVEGAHTGNLSAIITGAQGTGTWKDNLDCYGTVTLTKLEPVVDPIAGHIVNMDGDVQMVRNGGSQQAYPDELLYAKDVLKLGPASDANIVLGLQAQKIGLSAGTTYEVPDVAGK